uniref:proline and serine-rich protein 3 isoform X2 n=1 Tax=Scatophagus argus TaxID=75038 RepID=UPI001ED7D057|nr:proline and serine-rich protein 3 isoform X2 [Scatophagus argus]
MKSSGPVFTRQNPFQPASRAGKVHYHPSRNRPLSKKEKKTTLSPACSKERSSPQLHTLSPESHRPFEKHDHCFAVSNEQPVFEESWPSTDSGSSASITTSSDMETPKTYARTGKSTVSSELGVQQDSVLAKYIERFRHGPPQSREERQQIDSDIGEKQLPFWWLSPSSLPPSSTPTKTTDKDVIQPLKDDEGPSIFSPAGRCPHERSLSPCRGSLTVSAINLSDTFQGECDDTDILHLQERANILLLRDECALSDGSIHVSSEGLGCSDFSSPVSVDEPLRRPFIPSSLKSTTVKSSSDSVQAEPYQKSCFIPCLVPPTRPEEDILFQWRLRRKIEQAREWPLQHSSFHSPAFSWQASSLSNPSASGQVYKSPQPPEFSQRATHPNVTAPQTEIKEGHETCPPASGPPSFPASVVSGSSVSQPQAIAHVPAHMHLLCDVLPCPIQSSHAGTQQKNSQNIDETPKDTKVVCKNTQLPGKSMNTFTDEPIREDMPSLLSAFPGSIDRQGPGHYKTTQRSKNEEAQPKESQKKTTTSLKQQKKSRTSSHQRVPKKVIPWTEQQQQKGSQKVSSERRTGDYAPPPPPSPVHSALGQVVSEVLFPTVDSSPAQRTPVLSISPLRTVSPPPQSSVPPCNAQNSVGVISQLLQEAEDSDGKEFEDDPLLQVLRKQRTWVKEQISEVDFKLNELLDKQQVTYTMARDP